MTALRPTAGRRGLLMKARTTVLSACLAVFLQLSFGVMSGPSAKASGPDPVTITKHADLGFTTSIPVSVDTGVGAPPCLLTVVVCLFHGALAFSGTMNVGVKLGTDVALTYDPSDLNTPTEPLPVSVKYTPTPGGSTATYALTGNMTFNFDGCVNCPSTLPFSANSAPVSFTAPMDGDAPITIPGSSTSLTLVVAGLPVITASLGSSLTLAPAPPGSLPGLGGAAAVVKVTGASGAPVLPIEWDSAGAVKSFTLTTPAAPSPVVLFSGGLGPVYTAAGLDTAIGTAVGGIAGPLVAARVAAGFVPVPLTSPPLASIPPIG